MMFIFFIVSYLFCGCKGTKIIRNQKYHDCGILQKKVIFGFNYSTTSI